MLKATFVLDSETKGAVKYRERLEGGVLAQYPNSPGAQIGVLYIRKISFAEGSGYPKVLTMTLAVPENANASA